MLVRVFKYDGRMKRFRLFEVTSFCSTFEAYIKHFIYKYCFIGNSIDGQNIIFIPNILYRVEINDQVVSYFDHNFNANF